MQRRPSEAEDTNQQQQQQQHLFHALYAPTLTPVESSDDDDTRGFRPESVNISHTNTLSEGPDSAMDLDAGRDPPLSARENNTIDMEQDSAWSDAPRLPSPVSEDGGETPKQTPTPTPTAADSKAGPASDAEMSFLPGGSCSISPHQDQSASAPRKVTFCMGFRADCEKCQHKVPGHYSHIIRS